MQGVDRAAATLDDTIVFERFDPESYMQMLEAMGYPADLARMQLDMYADFIRHIRIAGTFGKLMKQYAARGRDVLLSLIAASAIVAIVFLMLQHRAPDVERTAFIDRRTLDTHNVKQVETANTEAVSMGN